MVARDGKPFTGLIGSPVVVLAPGRRRDSERTSMSHSLWRDSRSGLLSAGVRGDEGWGVVSGLPTVAGFVDLRAIGRGGFSTVYEATQQDLGRSVAIKVMNVDVSDESARRRFERECKVVGVLSGVKGIVAVHQSAFTADGRPCIVMERMGRGSLDDYVRTSGALSPTEGLELARVIAGALAAAHDRGVVHRDIKPGNILISESGEVALGDFGISVIADVVTSTQTEASLSPPHAPPEKFSGEPADEQLSDIYSLGSTIYFALSGAPPFGTARTGGLSGLMSRVMNDRLPVIERDDLPGGLYDLLGLMTSKNPTDRIASAEQVREAFDSLHAAQTAAPATPTGAATDTLPPFPTPPLPVGPPRSTDGGRAAPSADDPPSVMHKIVIPPPPSTATQAGSVVPAAAQVDDAMAADILELRSRVVVGYSEGAWPTATDYAAAVQDRSALADDEIKAAELTRDFMGMPLSASGQSAIVFQLDSADGPLAIRCYTRPPDEGSLRYRALARHLEQHPCNDLVAARWVDNAIVANDLSWPVVTMPWVPGRPLNLVVEDLLGRPAELRRLAASWLDVLDRLRATGVAHGDLQNGNVLVDEDLVVRLVDLDGIWVPSLSGHPPDESGHPNFQHPQRSAQDWGPEVDGFAGFVIYLSLVALAADAGLWAHHDAENLVLNSSDLQRPGATAVWIRLAQSPDADVRRMTAVLRECCTAAALPAGPVRGLAAARPVFDGALGDELDDVPTVRRDRMPQTGSATTAPAPEGPPTSTSPPKFVPNTPNMAEEGDWWLTNAPVEAASVAAPHAAAPRVAPAATGPASPTPVFGVGVASPLPSGQRAPLLAFLGKEAAVGGLAAGLLAGVLSATAVLGLSSLDDRLLVGLGVLSVLLSALLRAWFAATAGCWSAALSRFCVGALAGLPWAVLTLAARGAGTGVLLRTGNPVALTLAVGALGAGLGLASGLGRVDRRIWSGLLGGLLGGVLGGSALAVLIHLGREQSEAGAQWILAVGLSWLGAAIGGFIGVFTRYFQRFRLVVTSGRLTGREIGLDSDPVTIGSANSNTIVLRGDPLIAAEHLTLSFEEWWSNGKSLQAVAHASILVNSVSVQGEFPLADGDVLEVGGTSLRFECAKRRST